MLWVPERFGDVETPGKQVLRRAAPLAFGYFGAIMREDDLEFCEGGSGILTHPYSGLTAKHVGRQVLGLDGREKIPKYAFRTQHSATLFQHLNPLEDEPKGSLLHVTRAWDSPVTDITLLQVSHGEATRHNPTGYFKWRLLPPPVGEKVYLLGFPRFNVSNVDDEFEVRSDLHFIPARVTAIYRLRRPDAAPAYPCFEIDKAVDAGFSGGGVFYDDALCGLVSVSSTFEEKTWCASLWPMALLGYDSELPGVTTQFSDLFESKVIETVDWQTVRGNVERRENDFGEPYAWISEDLDVK